MDIKNIAVKDLIPYEKNTKKHDDVQIKNVAESIKQYGFVQPIVIDKTMWLLSVIADYWRRRN